MGVRRTTITCLTMLGALALVAGCTSQIGGAALPTGASSAPTVAAAGGDTTKDNVCGTPAPGALVLCGPLAREKALTGHLDLPANTVIVVRTTCPADSNIDLALNIADPDLKEAVESLCPQAALLPAAQRGKEHPGQAAFFARKAGRYRLRGLLDSVDSGASLSKATFELFSDTKPTVTSDAGLPVTATLRSAGSTLVVNSDGQSRSYRLSGVEKACVSTDSVVNTDPADTEPKSLGTDCFHDNHWSTDNMKQPIIVFNPKATPVTVTVSAG